MPLLYDNTGAQILLLLRNRIANDWASLCRELGIDPGYHTGYIVLRRMLYDLQAAGLIECDFPERIEVSKNWERIQSALGISLAEMAELRPGNTMIVTPHFGPPSELLKYADLFVLMPFTDELKPVYDDHIKNVAKNLNLTVARADDFFTASPIMRDVWAAVCAARAIIADCTGRNPNVFYEIGLAHTIGKPVILITQNSEDVPFDLKHIRYIPYQYTPRGMSDFEERLTETIKTVLEIE